MTDPIIPLGHYTEPDGTVVWKLRKRDFQRVNEGYGCAFCLQGWSFYLAACPSCGTETVPDVREAVA